MSLNSSATNSRQYHGSHQNEDLDATELLTSAGPGRSILTFKPKRNIFMQGCAADAVYYIKSGKVRLTVVSEHGREGVVAILGTGFFFGENCLTNPAVNTSSATAMVKTTVVRIEKSAMLRVLHAQPDLCDMFMSFLVQRNKQIEADLLDHLFNSSEQRLARILLQLAHLEESGELSICHPQNQPGHLGGAGRDDTVTNQFLHEQISQARLHPLRRQQRQRPTWPESQHIAHERDLSGVAAIATPARLSRSPE